MSCEVHQVLHSISARIRNRGPRADPTGIRAGTPGKGPYHDVMGSALPKQDELC